MHGIYFSVDNVIYGFRIMDASPPDYKMIFAITYDNIVVLDRNDLTDSLMSSMITDDRVNFSFSSPDKCIISCRGDGDKYTEDKLDCKIKGNPPNFKANGKFLLDSINSFTSTKVKIRLGKSKADPIMLTEPGFKTVIAPMVD